MKARWTLYLALLLVVSSGLDVLSTYRASPDLQREANVIVVSAGRSWASVFCIKILASSIAVLSFFLGLGAIERRRGRLAGKRGLVETYGYLLFSESVPVAKLLTGWPRDWRAALAVGGVLIGTAVVCAGFFGAAANTFRLVRSVVGLHVLYALSTVLGVALTIYLIYAFIGKSVRAESGAPSEAPGSRSQAEHG